MVEVFLAWRLYLLGDQWFCRLSLVFMIVLGEELLLEKLIKLGEESESLTSGGRLGVYCLGRLLKDFVLGQKIGELTDVLLLARAESEELP